MLIAVIYQLMATQWQMQPGLITKRPVDTDGQNACELMSCRAIWMEDQLPYMPMGPANHLVDE
jgi:hypothetical protein